MSYTKTNVAKPEKEKLDQMVLRIALILVLGAFAPLLDSTMVNLAINAITSDLKFKISVIQWVVTGYMLTMGLEVPISG